MPISNDIWPFMPINIDRLKRWFVTEPGGGRIRVLISALVRREFKRVDSGRNISIPIYFILETKYIKPIIININILIFSHLAHEIWSNNTRNTYTWEMAYHIENITDHSMTEEREHTSQYVDLHVNPSLY